MGRAPKGTRLSDDPAHSAEPAFGAFGPDELIQCYATGVFPMGEARDDPRVFLVEPEMRGILPLDALHVPSRLKRTIRGEPFQIRVNTAFDAVVDACAAPGRDREETWINAPIQRLYSALNARGQAYSVECWRDEALVGGLYGVTLGGAFFGESMFSRATDASKVALVHLVARLRRGGWRLLDAQFQTEHLSRFGAMETPQADYLKMLKPALAVRPNNRSLFAPMTGVEALYYALHSTTQAS